MSRLAVVLCLLFAAPCARAADAPGAPAYDGGGNHYRVKIDEGAAVAHVQAEVWLPSPSLAMFGVQQASDLPNGQAELLRKLEVRDASGRRLAIKDLGEGDFQLDGQGRVRISYDVLLEHDRHKWSAGAEEVAFHTPQGFMSTGYSLLLAPGDAMQGGIDIAFQLPRGWQAYAPWQATGRNAFSVPSRRELLSNALFFGTATAETMRIGGVDLTLLVGPKQAAAKPVFVELLRRQMESYREYFGGAPLSTRYQVLVNDGPDDGGSFASSFSQFIDGAPRPETSVGWGFVMSHELLHYWNGLSMVPADSREEWFKEGFTDYITTVTQSRNGLVERPQLYWHLENIARRYLIARVGQRLGMSLREAGADKQPNRELIYGGGALTAFALDVELRKASNERVGLAQLMQAMYAEFAKPGKTYTLADIERQAQALTGKDFREFFQRTVESRSFYDARAVYSDVGLRLDTWLYDEAQVRPDVAATPAQIARFHAIFGQD